MWYYQLTKNAPDMVLSFKRFHMPMLNMKDISLSARVTFWGSDLIHPLAYESSHILGHSFAHMFGFRVMTTCGQKEPQISHKLFKKGCPSHLLIWWDPLGRNGIPRITFGMTLRWCGMDFGTCLNDLWAFQATRILCRPTSCVFGWIFNSNWRPDASSMLHRYIIYIYIYIWQRPINRLLILK